MTEGWNGDDYLILFGEDEVAAASNQYRISQWLPGYEVVGFRSWDDFIVRNSAGQTYSVPTVPIVPEYLSAFALPDVGVQLMPDSKFRNSIKWYTQPIVFGGDPDVGENLIWVTHEQHVMLVNYWNDKYRDLKAKTR